MKNKKEKALNELLNNTNEVVGTIYGKQEISIEALKKYILDQCELLNYVHETDREVIAVKLEVYSKKRIKSENPDHEADEQHRANDSTAMETIQKFNLSNSLEGYEKSGPGSEEKRLATDQVDLKLWQLQNEELSGNQIYYFYNAFYYHSVEDLQVIETLRIEKQKELELKTATLIQQVAPAAIPKKTSNDCPFQWKDSDTDLLELVTAIQKTNSLVRKDGNPLTRKELIDYFMDLFGRDIKNVEVKLARATNRNEKTPFLDRLKLAFENYAEEKEDKLIKRK